MITIICIIHNIYYFSCLIYKHSFFIIPKLHSIQVLPCGLTQLVQLHRHNQFYIIIITYVIYRN